MLRALLRWLYARLGRRYVRIVLLAQFQLAFVVTAGGVALFTLFGDISRHDLAWLLVGAMVIVAIDNVIAFRVISRLIAPADPWMRGQRTAQSAVAAWRALAGLPLDFFLARNLRAAFFGLVPISAYATWLLGLDAFPSLLFVIAGAAVVLLYGMLLRFFAIEIITRPVIEEVSEHVPPDTDLGKATLSLTARLLLALPAINIIGGVVVSGISGGRGEGITALGWGVGAAILVAFTISLELSLLLARSIVAPLKDLRAGTRRVAAGDFQTRVPVLGSDETGTLAASFNTMVAGLQERERLRDALGAYVDPDVAQRILKEGTQLEGEEVEVSVLFLDIRDFTAFAERSSAGEVVGQLNEFFSRVVPVIQRHGGHANKFVGDGLLAVFGAPQRLSDHADRAVACALEVATMVREVYAGSLRIGIGINSGPVVAGTIGGGGRVEFTVIGDVVNTASRVEAVTRDTGDDVLLTDATRRLLTHDHGGLEARPTVELKGKTEQVALFAPACATQLEPRPLTAQS